MKYYRPINRLREIALVFVLLGSVVFMTVLSHAAHLAISNADFDHDGKTDPAVYSNGLWQVRLSANSYALVSAGFGDNMVLPCASDYDGDGLADPVVYEPSTGIWTVLLSSCGYARASLAFNSFQATPVVGDYDGDGKADPVVYEPATRTWTARLSALGYASINLAFGDSDSTPVAGDFDGDHLIDPAIYDEAVGRWQVKLSGSQYTEVMLTGFGGAGFQPVVGDYDGDGKADPALYQATAGGWSVKFSRYGYSEASIIGFGGTNYAPVTGDYDNDSVTDVAVYNLNNRTLTVCYSTSNNDPSDILSQTNILQSNRILFNAAKSADESVGILYCEQLSQFEYGPLYYEAVDSAGTVLCNETVSLDGEVWTPGLGESIPLLYDSGGIVHMFFDYPYHAITHLYRSQGTWTNEVLPLTDSLSSDFLGCLGPNDTFHLLSSAVRDENLLLFYATNQRGTWAGETLTIPLGDTMRFVGKDLAIDSSGNAHFVISLQDHRGDDVTWPGYLYYLNNQTGTWNMELVASRAHDQYDTAFWNPSLAVNANGQPLIAVHLRYNVLTGSDSLSQLVYAWRTGANIWNSEVLADTADNYFGSDGGHFTGIEPKLAIDRFQRSQIIFSDLASSHDLGYETTDTGQIRLAILSAGAWTLTTLLPQSAANHEGLTDKYLLLSADNDGLDIVARLYPGYAIVRFSNQRPSCFTF